MNVSSNPSARSPAPAPGRVAVYAGTFDPITRGHVAVIERAAPRFDRLEIAVAINPGKAPVFGAAERVEMIVDAAGHLPNVTVATVPGLVVDHARAIGARTLIRGIRSSVDLDAELTLAHLNTTLAPEIATLFVPAEAGLAEVSSSRLKELVAAGQDASIHCPPAVARRLAERLRAAAGLAPGALGPDGRAPHDEGAPP